MTPMETTSSVSPPKGATKIGKYSMIHDELDVALQALPRIIWTDKMRFKVKVTNSKIVFEKAVGFSARPALIYAGC